MSADNGIYILTTKRGRRGKEYRVIYGEAIDHLYYMSDYPSSSPRLNRDATIAHFSNARVFTDRKVAEGYAIRWLESRDEQGWITEDGIRWLEHPSIRFPRVAAPPVAEEDAFPLEDWSDPFGSLRRYL